MQRNTDFTFLLTCLFFFIFPIYSLAGNICLILLFINSLFKLKNIKRKWSKGHFLFFMPAFLYILYVIGFMHSDDTSEIFSFLETKLSLIVLPFIYYVTPVVDEMKIKKALQFFVLGLGLSFLYAFGCASYDWLINGESNFVYESLSKYIHGHPTYLSLFAGIALAIVYFTRDVKQWHFGKISRIFMSLIMIVAIILLSARMSLIVNVILGLGFVLLRLLKDYSLIKVVSILGVAMIVFVGLASQNEGVKSRFSDLLVKTDEGYKPNNVRLRIWDAGWQVIQPNAMLGVGSGDANPQLYIQYEKWGYIKSLNHKYNYHNQYFQTWSATGILGLLALLIMYFGPLNFRKLELGQLLVFIALAYSFGSVAESFFERQSGIVPFMVFNSLLLSYLMHRNSKIIVD